MVTSKCRSGQHPKCMFETATEPLQLASRTDSIPGLYPILFFRTWHWCFAKHPTQSRCNYPPSAMINVEHCRGLHCQWRLDRHLNILHLPGDLLRLASEVALVYLSVMSLELRQLWRGRSSHNNSNRCRTRRHDTIPGTTPRLINPYIENRVDASLVCGEWRQAQLDA